MFLTFFGMRTRALTFSFVAISTIFRDIGLLSLVLFLIWRDREPKERLGWGKKHVTVETLWGIILFLPIFNLAALLQSILQRFGLSAPQTSLPPFLVPDGLWEIGLAILLVIIVAISEETLFRGYLILRFTQVTKNRTAALFISSVIFALGHGYAGSSGVVTILGIGLALGLIYLWRQSLIAPVVIHFLQNFIGIVVVPFLR